MNFTKTKKEKYLFDDKLNSRVGKTFKVAKGAKFSKKQIEEIVCYVE